MCMIYPLSIWEKKTNMFLFSGWRGNNFLDIWGSFWSLILFLINFLLWNKINTYSKVQINPLSWIWVFLNFSIKTWSNFKIRDSFEIYMFSAFQNCPWFWNLTKIWWRNWGKTKSNWVDWFWLSVLLGSLF